MRDRQLNGEGGGGRGEGDQEIETEMGARREGERMSVTE